MKLNLDIKPHIEARLKKIQRRTETTSFLDVVRKALAVYDFITEAQVDKEAKIFIHYPDGSISEAKFE